LLLFVFFATVSAMQQVRIVAIGDSTTAGTPGYASPLEAPPLGRGDPASQYGYWLMRSHPDWEVLNRGVNGERSDQIRDRFDRDVISARPAVVVVVAGVNDVYQGRRVGEVTEQLRWMYDRAQRRGDSGGGWYNPPLRLCHAGTERADPPDQCLDPAAGGR
jgi:lysophospholipase L1-like esterase